MSLATAQRAAKRLLTSTSSIAGGGDMKAAPCMTTAGPSRGFALQSYVHRPPASPAWANCISAACSCRSTSSRALPRGGSLGSQKVHHLHRSLATIILGDSSPADDGTARDVAPLFMTAGGRRLTTRTSFSTPPRGQRTTEANGLRFRGVERHPRSWRCAPVVRKFLKVQQVATLLAVSRATVYRLVDEGRLERVWVGTAIRVPEPSVAAFLRQSP